MRRCYISVLGVVSSLAVIMLHINGCFWEFSIKPYWIIANIIESVMYFAVPVFFMLSGATLMDYRERYTTKEYFIKRIRKTLIPFVVWNLIGLVYEILRKRILLETLSLVNVGEMILNTQIIGIYWFFIPLFSIYMVIPLFSAVPKEKRKEIFSYLAVGGFVLNCLFPFLANTCNFSYNGGLMIKVVSEYLLYTIVGYLLSEYDLQKNRFIIYIAGICGLCIHAIGTYILSVDAGSVISTYKGYNNLPCVLYSVAIFVFLKEIVKRTEKHKMVQWIASFDKYTFSVYLMHYYLIDIMVALFDMDTTGIIYRLVSPFIIFVICVLIAKIVRKIPFGKYLLP
ncbi:MAG: acyltransferase [Tyzzerella sp.]|nr:acyltransferase [Tyzzerella sp.]